MSEIAAKMFKEGWRAYIVKRTVGGEEGGEVWVGKLTNGVLSPAESSMSRQSVGLALTAVASRIRANSSFDQSPYREDILALAMMTAQSSGAPPEEIDAAIAKERAKELFECGWRVVRVAKRGLGFHDITLNVHDKVDSGPVNATHLKSSKVILTEPVARELLKMSRMSIEP